MHIYACIIVYVYMYIHVYMYIYAFVYLVDSKDPGINVNGAAFSHH